MNNMQKMHPANPSLEPSKCNFLFAISPSGAIPPAQYYIVFSQIDLEWAIYCTLCG